MSTTVTETVTASPAAKIQSPPAEKEKYRYEHLLPVFTADRYPPLTPFRHEDPGHRALKHENPRAFLDAAKQVFELTPKLGTEVHGVSLASLDSDGKDQLALEVARRGILVFRDQEEFIEKGADFWKEFGKHFGRLHIHQTSGHPANHPEIHLVYRDPNTTFNHEREDSITTTWWHSDVSYELQPPGLTTFFLLDSPKTGGDTLFTSNVTLFNSLSSQFKDFLRTLKAVHSAIEQADRSRAGKIGGTVRRDPVEHVHPVVRRHPVTGEEGLYVNRQFTRRIVGLKKEESDVILNFLLDHIDKSGDAQARVKWSPYTITVWDNRILTHSPIIDYTDSKDRRHGARITPQAERPIAALEGLNLDS